MTLIEYSMSKAKKHPFMALMWAVGGLIVSYGVAMLIIKVPEAALFIAGLTCVGFFLAFSFGVPMEYHSEKEIEEHKKKIMENKSE